MVMGDDLTLGGGYTMQHADHHVSQDCALETYMILLAGHPNKLNLKKRIPSIMI